MNRTHLNDEEIYELIDSELESFNKSNPELETDEEDRELLFNLVKFCVAESFHSYHLWLISNILDRYLGVWMQRVAEHVTTDPAFIDKIKSFAKDYRTIEDLPETRKEKDKEDGR